MFDDLCTVGVTQLKLVAGRKVDGGDPTTELNLRCDLCNCYIESRLPINAPAIKCKEKEQPPLCSLNKKQEHRKIVLQNCKTYTPPKNFS